MSRRIDIELTSTRDDGVWTWRAAGAKQPKGVVARDLLPGEPSVGDVLRADVETGLDGSEVTSVLPPKGSSPKPDLLELARRELSEDELVTSKLVGKRGRRDRDDDGDRRGGRKGRDGRPGGGRDGRPGGGRDGRPGGGRDGRPGGSGRDGRPGGDSRGRDDRGRDGRGEGGRGPRPERTRRPRPEDKPKPKRLRARRAHRKAVLDTLEVHERPIAEEVLRGGIPAVRQAVEKQNEQARAEGRPEVDPAQLESLAERLLPRLRTAEWRDRADAALADIEELDLRDLRTVVVAADSAARDDETRALATQLKEGLERRIEADQAAWLAEMSTLLGDGRVVRALRVSSRPPKAGSLLPADLATRLTEAASASLTADTPTDRWATVLDALSLSPVHARVAPESLPASPSDELKAAVAAAGEKVPLVAQALGVEPVAAKPRRGPRRGGAKSGGGSRPGGPAKGPQGKGPDTRPVPPPPPAATPAPAEGGPPAADPSAAPAAPEAESSAASAAPEAEAPAAPAVAEAPQEAPGAAPAAEADTTAEAPAAPAAPAAEATPDAPSAPPTPEVAPAEAPASEDGAAAPADGTPPPA